MVHRTHKEKFFTGLYMYMYFDELAGDQTGLDRHVARVEQTSSVITLSPLQSSLVPSPHRIHPGNFSRGKST